MLRLVEPQEQIFRGKLILMSGGYFHQNISSCHIMTEANLKLISMQGLGCYDIHARGVRLTQYASP